MVQYKILFRTDVNCGKKETETGKIIIRVNLCRMIVITDNYIVFDMDIEIYS